jgi:hypothetical protein
METHFCSILNIFVTLHFENLFALVVDGNLNFIFQGNSHHFILSLKENHNERDILRF